MTIPFERKHLQELDLTEESRRALRVPKAIDIMEKLATLDLCETVLSRDKKPIGVIGASPISYNACEVFILSTKQQRRCPLSFIKAVKEHLSRVRSEFRYIHASSVDSDFCARFFDWLGFRRMENIRINDMTFARWRMAGNG